MLKREKKKGRLRPAERQTKWCYFKWPLYWLLTLPMNIPTTTVFSTPLFSFVLDKILHSNTKIFEFSSVRLDFLPAGWVEVMNSLTFFLLIVFSNVWNVHINNFQTWFSFFCVIIGILIPFLDNSKTESRKVHSNLFLKLN